MKFPGDNKIELSSEATDALLAKHLADQFGDTNIRVKDVKVDYGGNMTVRFTTDPVPPPPPENSPTPPTPPTPEPRSAEDEPL